MLVFGQIFLTKNEIKNSNNFQENELFLTFQLEYFNLKDVISKCSVRFVENKNCITNMISPNHLFFSNAYKNNTIFPLSQEQMKQIDTKISEIHELDHMEAKKKFLSITSKGIRKMKNRLLPKEAKEFLKGWFYKNFAHPYPRLQDKLELVKRTGLSLSQVNSWFYKARVWKSQKKEKKKRTIKRKRKETEQNIEESKKISEEEEIRIPLPSWRLITPKTAKDFENDNSSDEDTSDEFYQKLHSVREQEERQRRLQYIEKEEKKHPRIRRRKQKNCEENHCNNMITCKN